MATLRRPAWLFRAGQYPDKGVSADRSFLDRLAAGLNDPGGKPPVLDLEHAPTERVLDIGRAVTGTARVVHGAPPGGEEGDWLMADIDVSAELDERLKSRGLSVALDMAKGAIEKIAVTAAPRVRGAQFSEPGGYLMSKRDMVNFGEEGQGAGGATDTPTPPTETEVEGIFTKLRNLLGLGGNTDITPPPPSTPAPAFGDKPETPSGDEALKAQMAQQAAEIEALKKLVEDTQKQASNAQLTAEEQRLKAFSAELKAKGVPPWLVDTLAPVALGQPKVKVAFATDDGTVEVKDLDQAGAARLVLDRFSGTVPTAALFDTDDRRQVDPDTQLAERARAIKKANPTMSITEAQVQADAEFAAANGGH